MVDSLRRSGSVLSRSWRYADIAVLALVATTTLSGCQTSARANNDGGMAIFSMPLWADNSAVSTTADSTSTAAVEVAVTAEHHA